MAGREEAKLALLRDLPVEHGQVLVQGRRLVEALIDVLEEPGRDLAEQVELVVRPEQERLMEHGRHQGVRRLVARHVRHQDAGPLLGLAQTRHDPRVAGRLRLADAAVQVVPLLEVEVDQVVPADRLPQRHGDAVDVHTTQVRKIAGRRLRRQGDLLQVGQLGTNLGLPAIGWTSAHGNPSPQA